MPNNTLDRAIEAVPKFEERISLFTKKLRLAQYADSSIYNYRLKIAQAVLYLGKIPDNFTQTDVDDYLSMLLDRNRYTISHFKHTVCKHSIALGVPLHKGFPVSRLLDFN